MICPRLRRLNALFAATIAGFFLSASPTLAVGRDGENATTPPAAGGPVDTENKGRRAKAKGKGDGKTASEAKADAGKNARLEDLDEFRTAYRLIQHGRYEAGIVALRALRHDTHAEVANLLGFASRKLGRYDDAKFWYETALATDPHHVRTWSYYGMWHAEQGNRLKAEGYLEKVQAISGSESREYAELKSVIDGTFSY